MYRRLLPRAVLVVGLLTATLKIGENHTGSTLVINHRVREGNHSDYERWLEEIVPACGATDGFLDWSIVRPIDGLTHHYTFIIRFDTEAHPRGWMESPVRAALIEKVQPLLVSGDDFYVRSGLDFWFTPSAARAALPVRWKQYLITWSAICPLVLVAPLAIVPVLDLWHLRQNRLLMTLAVTGVVVFVMVYVVMPRYTRLLISCTTRRKPRIAKTLHGDISLFFSVKARKFGDRFAHDSPHCHV